MKKLTEEQKQNIRSLQEAGLKDAEISRKLNINYATIYAQRSEVKERKREYRRQYRQRPEVKEQTREQRREYRQRPEVKEHQREYRREHRQRPEVNKHQRGYEKAYRNLTNIIIAIFDKKEFAEPELLAHLKQETGVKFKPETIANVVNSLGEKLGENSPIVREDGKYKLNKDSPYWKICNGYWHGEEK